MAYNNIQYMTVMEIDTGVCQYAYFRKPDFIIIIEGEDIEYSKDDIKPLSLIEKIESCDNDVVNWNNYR